MVRRQKKHSEARRRPVDPRAARYKNRLEDLETAWTSFTTQDPGAEVDPRDAAEEFVTEVINVCRLDSRLLKHPIVEHIVRHWKAWSARDLLKKLPGGLEKGVKRPWKQRELDLAAQVEELRASMRKRARKGGASPHRTDDEPSPPSRSILDELRSFQKAMGYLKPPSAAWAPQPNSPRPPREEPSIAQIKKRLVSRGLLRPDISDEGVRKLVRRLDAADEGSVITVGPGMPRSPRRGPKKTPTRKVDLPARRG